MAYNIQSSHVSKDSEDNIIMFSEKKLVVDILEVEKNGNWCLPKNEEVR